MLTFIEQLPCVMLCVNTWHLWIHLFSLCLSEEFTIILNILKMLEQRHLEVKLLDERTVTQNEAFLATPHIKERDETKKRKG